MDLSEQKNTGIIVNQPFSKIQNNLASSEQSLMPIMDDSFFIRKNVEVILDRLRPLIRSAQYWDQSFLLDHWDQKNGVWSDSALS